MKTRKQLRDGDDVDGDGHQADDEENGVKR